VTPDPSHFIQPRGTSIPYLLPFLLTTPQELNGYFYCLNDPVNAVDPSHHSLKKMGKSLILDFKELCGFLGSYTMLPLYCKKNLIIMRLLPIPAKCEFFLNPITRLRFLRVSLRVSHVISLIYTAI